ncbi:MAG: hypothetical protein VKJ04_05345 [Vampirovibrionales bacterium]|nr:hypothetical protein [Vampirovibrionales bacterium]
MLSPQLFSRPFPAPSPALQTGALTFGALLLDGESLRKQANQHDALASLASISSLAVGHQPLMFDQHQDAQRQGSCVSEMGVLVRAQELYKSAGFSLLFGFPNRTEPHLNAFAIVDPTPNTVPSILWEKAYAPKDGCLGNIIVVTPADYPAHHVASEESASSSLLDASTLAGYNPFRYGKKATADEAKVYDKPRGQVEKEMKQALEALGVNVIDAGPLNRMFESQYRKTNP